MKRGDFVVASGAGVLSGVSTISEVQTPAFGLDFEIIGSKIDRNPSSVSRIEVNFTKLEMTPKYVDTNDDVKLSVELELDGYRPEEKQISFNPINGHTFKLSNKVNPVSLDVDYKDRSFVKGSVTIQVEYKNRTDEYVRELVISKNNAVPQSTIAHYDANEISASNGDNISTWNDILGNYDLNSGTAGTYRSNGINGNPAVEFTGSEYLRWNNNVDFINRECCVMFVMKDPSPDDNNHIVSFRENGESNGLIFRFRDSNRDVWLSQNGPTWNPPTTPSVNGINIQNKTDQEYDVRWNGNSRTGTRNYEFPTVKMGVTADADGSLTANATIGEIIVCNSGLTDAEYNSQLNRLANKWDVTF